MKEVTYSKKQLWFAFFKFMFIEPIQLFKMLKWCWIISWREVKNNNMKKNIYAGVSLENLPAFKRAYNQAVKENQETFVFNGADISIAYAEDIIEQLEDSPRGTIIKLS